MSILFLAKEKPFAKDAADTLRRNFVDVVICIGSVGDPFPTFATTRAFDVVISYISPWIVPRTVLEQARVAAINFHPGPPNYPGIGCTNFALYHNERTFGITVHHMNERVDTGAIIAVERFPIFHHDSVFSLTQRCYAYIFTSFVRIASDMLEGKPLPSSDERWTRAPYTRKELNALCSIDPSMSIDEIRRRVRATTYPNMPGAFMEVAGTKFMVEPALDASC